MLVIPLHVQQVLTCCRSGPRRRSLGPIVRRWLRKLLIESAACSPLACRPATIELCGPGARAVEDEIRQKVGVIPKLWSLR